MGFDLIVEAQEKTRIHIAISVEKICGIMEISKTYWAVHRHTVAELIMERADAEKEHMGLATWESAPDGKIVKLDVSIAKNYLSDQSYVRMQESNLPMLLEIFESNTQPR